MSYSKIMGIDKEIQVTWHASDISHVSEFECVFIQPDNMELFHLHYEIELNLIVEGGMTYLHGENVVHLPKGTLAVFWAAKPHKAFHVESNTRFYLAYIPFIWFLRWHLHRQFRQTLLNGTFYYLDMSKDMPNQCAVFRRWCNDLEHGTAEDMEALEMEVEAYLLRISGQIRHITPDFRDTRPELKMPRTIENLHSEDKIVQMVLFMAQHYTSPIAVPDVAKAVKLHPNYASTLFKSLGGLTILDFLTQLRVVHAQMLLATTEDHILDIAFASGFSSSCGFYRAFRSICAQTPRAYRLSMRVQQ